VIKFLKSILYNKYQSYKFRKIISQYDKVLKLSSINNNEIINLNQNGFLILKNYIKNIDNYEIIENNWNQYGKAVKKINNILITKKSLIHKILTDQKINDIIKGYLGIDAVLDYVEFQKININSSFESISESWHYDNVGKRIKLFIYLNDCEKIFTKYLGETNKLKHKDYSTIGSRIKNSTIKKYIHKEVELTPKRGSIAIIDTNGYHKGVFRGNDNEPNSSREMIVLEFSSKKKSSKLSKISDDIGPRFVFFDEELNFDKMLINKDYLTKFKKFYFYDQNYVDSF
jgi:hypothetical protein